MEGLDASRLTNAQSLDIEFDGFDWDEGNWLKCAKHGVSQSEIERALSTNPVVLADRTGSREKRFNAIGPVGSRYVFTVFTFRIQDGRQLIRPISARYMHAKEVARHERRNAR